MKSVKDKTKKSLQNTTEWNSSQYQNAYNADDLALVEK